MQSQRISDHTAYQADLILLHPPLGEAGKLFARTLTHEARLGSRSSDVQATSHKLMGSAPEISNTGASNWRTECGKPVRDFRGRVSWCEECDECLRSGEVPRICEPWDTDPTPAEERYRALFRAAQTVWRAGIVDENEIIPTLVFAARSFELLNLSVMRDQLAEAEVGGEKWRDLKGTVRRAFDTFEVLRVEDGVPIVYSRPFKLRAHTYQETGIVEKVVIEVYRRSAKGEEIAKWYDTLLSKHGVSYEGRQGGFGWHASTGRLQMVFHRLAPTTLDPLLEGRIEVNKEERNLPLPHPDIVADMCEALIGSVSTRVKSSGFASFLGGRDRGRSFESDYLIPAVVAWYVGGRGNVIKQHDLKPKVAKVLHDNLDDNLLRARGKRLFHDEGWDSGEYIWEFVERISQPILRVDHELREGYFGPLGYIFPE